MAQKDSYRFTSPVGILNYIRINKPDTKFGPPTYCVTLVLPPDEAKAMVKAMEALDERYVGKIPFKKEDGGIAFKIKQKQYLSWIDKKTHKKVDHEMTVNLLNKDNSPYTGPDPWGGTTGEVAMTVDVTKSPQGAMMVALRLRGIRFHDIVEGDDGDPLFSGTSAGGSGNASSDESEEVFESDEESDDDFFG